jgi:nitrate reductase gamma subunit
MTKVICCLATVKNHVGILCFYMIFLIFFFRPQAKTLATAVGQSILEPPPKYLARRVNQPYG